MSDTIFRVHPAINFARVGNSEEYYIAPETAAGELVDKNTGLFGGLPIKPGTEDTPIDESDFRDSNEAVKRQAARFRIFAYECDQKSYPAEDKGTEVTIGKVFNGKKVKDIVWTVHLANKKNNWHAITSDIKQPDGSIVKDELGIDAYKPDADGNYDYPPIRDPKNDAYPPIANLSDDLNDPQRRTSLVIDAGPRTISSANDIGKIVNCDDKPNCSYTNADGSITNAKNYPISFPYQHFDLKDIYGRINTLGELQVEPNSGRLVVTGGYGRASGICLNENLPPLKDAIDNNYWFDDTSDGPVNATVIFEDDSTATVIGGWVVTTDPGYAPQTRNVVSTWDDMFNTWVEELNLTPDLYKDGQYQDSCPASWESDVLPLFHGAFLQRWNTNLPDKGVKGHDMMANLTYMENPQQQIPNFKALIRDPNVPEEDSESVKMPLALGDASKSFLSLSRTQYFLLMQWYAGKSKEAPVQLGAGEKLDKVVLQNCLGGRYSPGIDLTFIVRDINLYKQDWQGANGPFRINEQSLDYQTVQKDTPFLEVGYIPLQTAKVEPGDLSKFMSQPWHTDYNSCAVHTPSPNPSSNNTLYWSWPAQRPVQVHPKELCSYDADKDVWQLGGQLFSVRGDEEGSANLTHTNKPQDEGKYQHYLDYVENWHKVGFVIQGLQIPAEQGDNYGADKFLEVSSHFTSYGDPVQGWPTASIAPLSENND